MKLPLCAVALLMAAAALLAFLGKRLRGTLGAWPYYAKRPPRRVADEKKERASAAAGVRGRMEHPLNCRIMSLLP